MADRSRRPLREDAVAGAGTRSRQVAVTLISFACVVVTAVGLDVIVGWRWALGAVVYAPPGLLVCCVFLQLLALVSYALPYWAALRIGDGPQVRLNQAVVLSVIGFSAFLPWGGVDFDKRVLARQTDAIVARRATRVLGFLEYAVLSPAAWVAALFLITSGAKGQRSLYLSWIVGVPTGVAVAIWGIRYRDRIPHRWSASRWVCDAIAFLAGAWHASTEELAGRGRDGSLLGG
jgi:hypothetical protein